MCSLDTEWLMTFVVAEILIVFVLKTICWSIVSDLVKVTRRHVLYSCCLA